MNAPAKLRSLPDLVAEYDAKLAAIPEAVAAYQAAGADLMRGATIGGEHGGETIDTRGMGTEAKTLERNLRRSVWSHVWNGLNLPIIASARDKKKWEQSLADPPPFTLDNLRATLGPYLENPRATILRGMAEVFADLDPAYKSHEKVKIGVKGLPKRVIISGYGRAQISDILNALAAYQGKPLPSHIELAVLKENGDAMRDGGEYPDPYENRYARRGRVERGEPEKTVTVIGRCVWLKTFQNGNSHLFFGPEALRDINLALAEFYGDVLADCPDADRGILSAIQPDPEPQPVEIPRHPTEVMIDAGLYHMPSDVSWSDMFTAWTAMFDAVLLDGGATDYAPATPSSADMVSVETVPDHQPFDIPEIGNYYGGLWVKREGGNDFWSIENYDGHYWIPCDPAVAAALRALAGEGER